VEARVRIAVVVTGLSLAALPLLAQRAPFDDGYDSCRDRDWGGGSRAHYCEIRNTGFKAGGALSVDPGENGAIRVSGWDRDSVAVIVKVQAQARTDEDAQAIARAVRITAAGGTLRAEGPATSGRESWSVSFDVSVPRRSDLTARAVNGPIAVGDVTGKLDLDGVNGPLELAGVGGDVHARTVNGPLVVTLSGEKWDGTGLDSETENGPVTLSIPSAYAAHLETGTENGPVSIDFPVTIQGHFDGRSIATDLNGGGPTVRAVTTNGPLTVRRR